MKRLTLSLALVLLGASLFAADDLRTGVWSAQLDGDSIQLNLVRPSSRDRDHQGINNIGTRIRLSALSGLTAAEIAALAADVHFSMPAPAGTIAFDGRFSKGLGAGNFRFTPDEGFLREMESLGYSDLGDDRLLMFAFESFRPQTVRELRALGYTIDKRQLDEIAIFKIDADRVKEYAALGYPNLTLRELVNFRVGHIDAGFIKGIREVGFSDVPAQQMANLGILGVTPEYVRELKAAGLTSLTPRTATNLKIGHITGAKIAEYRRLGYELTPRQLGDFGIHGVTPQFIEEARARGEKDLTPERLIEMRIFRHRER